MCIDGFVVSNLLIPSAPRISPSAIFCLDFLMFAAALTAGSLVAVSDQDENGTRPWTVILIITATFTILTSYVPALPHTFFVRLYAGFCTCTNSLGSCASCSSHGHVSTANESKRHGNSYEDAENLLLSLNHALPNPIPS